MSIATGLSFFCKPRDESKVVMVRVNAAHVIYRINHTFAHFDKPLIHLISRVD